MAKFTHAPTLSKPSKSIVTIQNQRVAPAVITRTKADTIVTLSRKDYREFADLCKAEASKLLNLTSIEDIGNAWGALEFCVLPGIADVSIPNSKQFEKGYISLVTRINTAAFRRAGRERPECDCSELNNSEIFRFVIWHEIGHVCDNFDPFAAFRSEPDIKAAYSNARLINEVLADRFAWERIRPGQAMPLTEHGRRNADVIDRHIETMGKVLTRGNKLLRPLETGQYLNVPSYMLASKRKAAYVGPDIDPNLLTREIEYYREHFSRNGRRMRGVKL